MSLTHGSGAGPDAVGYGAGVVDVRGWTEEGRQPRGSQEPKRLQEHSLILLSVEGKE